MKRSLKLLLVAIALVLIASPASAQSSMHWAGSLYGGYAKMTGDGSPDGSFGARGNLFAQFDPVIGVGAELGWYSLGSVETTVGPTTDDMDFSAFQATAQVRARGVNGTVRPYGTGGLGMYGLKSKFAGESDSDTKFGFNLGGGMMFGSTANPVTFGVEGRWHSISTEGDATDVVSFMGGVNFH